jgi:hypothetical protein
MLMRLHAVMKSGLGAFATGAELRKATLAAAGRSLGHDYAGD